VTEMKALLTLMMKLVCSLFDLTIASTGLLALKIFQPAEALGRERDRRPEQGETAEQKA
jgi:hypothetical protein